MEIRNVDGSVGRHRVSLWLYFVLAAAVSGCGSATAPDAPERPPVITKAAFAGPDPTCPGQSIGVGLVADDPDNDNLTVTWTASGGSVVGDGPMVAWNAPQEPGMYSLQATVSDGRGGEVSSDVDVHVQNGTLLAFSTHDGLAKVADDGTWTLVVPGGFRSLGVWAGRPYLQAFLPQGGMSMCAADLGAGTVDCGPSGEYPVAAGQLDYGQRVMFLPDGGLAVLAADSTTIWRGDGSRWKTRHEPGGRDATVAGGGLLTCCTDEGDIVTVDLVKGGFGSYSPFGLDWMTAINEGRFTFSVLFAGGRVYYGVASTVVESNDIGVLHDLFSTGSDRNVSAMVVIDHYLYAALNAAGKIYRADLTSGTAEVFAEGFYLPTQLACLPGGEVQP